MINKANTRADLLVSLGRRDEPILPSGGLSRPACFALGITPAKEGCAVPLVELYLLGAVGEKHFAGGLT